MTNYTWGADGVARGNYAGINIWCICGIPEGVILPVKDSKKTNKKQRAKIVEKIKDKCIWSLGSTTSEEIDELGIQQAEKKSLVTAYHQLRDKGFIITELHGDLGMPSFYRVECIKSKDADDLVPAVSAASIFAKWALDDYWKYIHNLYPQYDFINNAGYGVKAKEKIAEFGLLEGIHRYSYKPCREYLELCNLNKV